ncbi:MAG: AraC family transcriptional regulator [Rikenellaceae bacterium]|nr:AraC family transcriptional regulator [Rikenellaceae bacterium]
MARHGIGYLINGKKYIYEGDNTRLEVNGGDMFYIGVGSHYIEDVPDEQNRFEQIVLYYNTEQLYWIISQLNLNYGIEIGRNHVCDRCRGKKEIKYPAWEAVRELFRGINVYIKNNLFAHDEAAVSIKITELVYLLFTNPNCCLLSKVLYDTSRKGENFEQIVRQHIFSDISIEELALKCNRSATQFKKDFFKCFYESPHKWIVKQRLIHARLLLISSDRAISDVGKECTFLNTSHFIKTFKKEFGLTPAHYRAKYNKREAAERASYRNSNELRA